MDNIFFDVSKLNYCGRNVIIGKTVRIRYPELVSIGNNCIIDDFTYISTSLELDDYVHIASGCKLIGGPKSMVRMGNFSTLSPGVVLAAGSDDYLGGIATPLVPYWAKGDYDIGDIFMGKHCIVGANSVVLPWCHLKDGVAIGALSLGKGIYEPYKLYAGIPAKYLKDRKKEEILKMEKRFYDTAI